MAEVGKLELPLDGELYSICLSRDSVCYTNGACAYMYGASHTHLRKPWFSLSMCCVMAVSSSDRMSLIYSLPFVTALIKLLCRLLHTQSRFGHGMASLHAS